MYFREKTMRRPTNSSFTYAIPAPEMDTSPVMSVASSIDLSPITRAVNANRTAPQAPISKTALDLITHPMMNSSKNAAVTSHCSVITQAKRLSIRSAVV